MSWKEVTTTDCNNGLASEHNSERYVEVTLATGWLKTLNPQIKLVEIGAVMPYHTRCLHTVIDPYDETLLNNHRSAFQEIYNSLSGEGEAIEAIRELLRSVLDIHTPEVFSLHQNYPNPFNPTTTIQFDLPTDESVSLTVYDILGRTVIELVKNINYQTGTYSIVFDGSQLSSGVYFYTLQAGRYHEIKKMLVIK